VVVKVERRGASVGGDDDGGEDLDDRIVIAADRVDDSVEERKAKGGEERGGRWKENEIGRMNYLVTLASSNVS
jgi:hypothetical protein